MGFQSAERTSDNSPALLVLGSATNHLQSVKRTTERLASVETTRSRPFHGLGTLLLSGPSTQSAGLLSLVRSRGLVESTFVQSHVLTVSEKGNHEQNRAIFWCDPHGKTFFKRLAKWLTYVLDVSEEAVFDRVVYTNAVKCTTQNNKRPSWDPALTCHLHHLSKEIDVWNPKLVVALGNSSSEYLAGLGISFEFLPHPSHREHSEYHVPYCDDLRSKLRQRI